MPSPTQAELLAQMAEANKELTEELRAVLDAVPKKAHWWTDWIKPQTLMALIGLFVMGILFYQSVQYHHDDNVRHHTIEELDNRYVQTKIRDMQDDALTEKLDTLNKHLDAIEEQMRSR